MSLTVAWANHITSAIDPSGPSNPLRMTVEHQAGGWLANETAYP